MTDILATMMDKNVLKQIDSYATGAAEGEIDRRKAEENVNRNEAAMLRFVMKLSGEGVIKAKSSEFNPGEVVLTRFDEKRRAVYEEQDKPFATRNDTTRKNVVSQYNTVIAVGKLPGSDRLAERVDASIKRLSAKGVPCHSARNALVSVAQAAKKAKDCRSRLLPNATIDERVTDNSGRNETTPKTHEDKAKTILATAEALKEGTKTLASYTSPNLDAVVRAARKLMAEFDVEAKPDPKPAKAKVVKPAKAKAKPAKAANTNARAKRPAVKKTVRKAA